MSVSSYQNDVARLQREIGDLRGNIASKNAEIARSNQDVASALKSVNSASTPSALQSALSRLTSKQQSGARLEQAAADLQKRLGSKMSDLGRAQERLASAQSQEERRQKQETEQRQKDEKKRTEEQLKRSKDVTKEYEKQSAIQLHMKRQAVIEIAALPEKIRILVCAANPSDEERLFLDEEVRFITNQIRASEKRDSVELIPALGLRSIDLLQAMNQHKPHIVHFSGHGSKQDEIIFLDEAGMAKAVSKAAIVGMLSSTATNLRVVVFNTCFSRNQAEEMTQHIEAAIGMSDSIGDNAARNFSGQFYSAIGFGLSIGQAFMQAKTYLMAENDNEAQTPMLFTKDGVDANEIILVKPS